MRTGTTAVLWLAVLVPTVPARPAVIGHSVAAQPLTIERIETLPEKDRAAWRQYLKRSDAARAADQAALQRERKGMGALPQEPATGRSAQSMPLDRDPQWYASAEARHIADVIVSFQTPAGGWGKNMDMTGETRKPGQSFVSNNLNKFPSPGDLDAPRDPSWHYVGTLDNDATTTEMLFLAKVQATLPGHEAEAYRAAFLRGVRYLLEAQYPNGGWPQVWPLDGGYHDAVTFNDDADLHATELLADVAATKAEFGFVPKDFRSRAADASRHALDCILKSQVVLRGRSTIWGQQHDVLTLEPVAARNFEPASLASSESAHILEYLETLPAPSPAVQVSVTAGVNWLQAHAMYGEAVEGGRGTPGGRHALSQPGAGPLWARFYSLTTETPVFGDRDKTIHDDMNELSLERRNGYAWYNTDPAGLLSDGSKGSRGENGRASVHGPKL